MIKDWILWLGGSVPLLLLLGMVLVRRWRQRRRGEREPLRDALLRPAGHSLNERIASLSDEFAFAMMVAYLASLGAFGRLNVPGLSLVGQIVFGGAALGFTGLAWSRLIDRRNSRFGLLGEQAVAEELQPLWAEDYKVYHDLPAERLGNIDHVVVGPGGVFAIETKMRMKRPGLRGHPDHEAICDGDTIVFPHYAERKAIPQARRSADWLASHLAQTTGATVAVTPVVALPGWFVTRKTRNGGIACNPRLLVRQLKEQRPVLSREQINDIAMQIEKRCRDVVY